MNRRKVNPHHILQSLLNHKSKKTDAKTFTIMSGNDIRKEIRKHWNHTPLHTNSAITANIKKVVPIKQLTQEIDGFIDDKLYSRQYNFCHPFIITNPYQIAPLTALIVFFTKKPCKVKVIVNGKSLEGNLEFYFKCTQYHKIPVIGLYPGHKNQIILELYDHKNRLLDQHKIKISTKPLPIELIDAVHKKVNSHPSLMGLTLVSGRKTPYPFAFDAFGDIRYYLKYQTNTYGIFPLSNNRFIIMDPTIMIPTYREPHSAALYEMDYLGRVYQTYYVGNGVCQDIQEKVPSGNLLMVSNSYDGYMGDKIVELDRQSGEIVKTLDLKDIFSDTFCKKSSWANLNSVSYNETKDTLLLSIRSLNAIVNISWKTNEILWILANPKPFKKTPYKNKLLKPTSEFQWHNQQNAVYQISDVLDDAFETIDYLVYDNHTLKEKNPTKSTVEALSYVKVYRVNGKEKTVSLIEQYQVPRSKAGSNAILDSAKHRLYIMSGCLVNKLEHEISMIYEIDIKSNTLINQFSLSHTFHRGYLLSLDYRQNTEPQVLKQHGWLGELAYPRLLSVHIPKPDKKLLKKSGIKFSLTDNILLLQGKDHQIKEIILSGNNHQYLCDFNLTIQEKPELYGKLTYSIPIPLDSLEPDNYDIYITLKKHTFYTSKVIKVH